MNTKRLKRMTLIILVFASLFICYSYAIATEYSSTVGTPDTSTNYGGTPVNLPTGSHILHYKVYSFQFHGGLPSNVFPVGKNFKIRFKHTNVETYYTSVDTSYKRKNYTVQINGIQPGVKTDYSNGITTFVRWDPDF